MAGVLLSGPAGGGKSQRALELLGAATVPTIVTDIQTIYAGLLQLQRDPETGRYPPRLEEDVHALQLAEGTRQAQIRMARENGTDIITTNSIGALARRQALLAALGPGAIEEVIDPGRDVVAARLADPVSGILSLQCEGALSRWFGENRSIEIRQEANELVGTLIQEGRASSGGRSELFTPNSVEWLNTGVDILDKHEGNVEARVTPERQADGAITFSAKLTDGMRRAWNDGRRFMSVEFHALESRTVRGGVREVQRALVTAGAMVKVPEYDSAVIELRDQSSPETNESENDLWRLL